MWRILAPSQRDGVVDHAIEDLQTVPDAPRAPGQVHDKGVPPEAGQAS